MSMIRDWPGWAVAIGLGILVFIVLSVGEYLWKEHILKYFKNKKNRPTETESETIRKLNKKLSDLGEDCENLKRQAESSEDELLALKRDFGIWRVRRCGESDDSLGLSVAIHFVDPKDVPMAEKIRQFFWMGSVPPTSFPWKKTHDIGPISWFRNRSGTARIVIFSDCRRAEGIKSAFNDSNLLGEPVDRWEMNFASDEASTADIVFVVFPGEPPF